MFSHFIKLYSVYASARLVFAIYSKSNTSNILINYDDHHVKMTLVRNFSGNIKKFSGGGGNFLVGFEIFSGGVEKFFTFILGGVEIFFWGGWGFRNFRRVEILLKGIEKVQEGLRNIRGVEKFSRWL